MKRRRGGNRERVPGSPNFKRGRTSQAHFSGWPTKNQRLNKNLVTKPPHPHTAPVPGVRLGTRPSRGGQGSCGWYSQGSRRHAGAVAKPRGRSGRTRTKATQWSGPVRGPFRGRFKVTPVPMRECACCAPPPPPADGQIEFAPSPPKAPYVQGEFRDL